jgi:hypothetical protein
VDAFRSPFSDLHVDQATIASVPALSGSYAATTAIEEITESPWERSLRRARNNGRTIGAISKGSISEQALAPILNSGGQPILLDWQSYPGATSAGAGAGAAGDTGSGETWPMSQGRIDELMAKYKSDQDAVLADAFEFMQAYYEAARHAFWEAQTGRHEAPPDWWTPAESGGDGSNPGGVGPWAVAHGFTDYASIAGSGGGTITDIVRLPDNQAGGNALLPYMSAFEYAKSYAPATDYPPQPGPFDTGDKNSEWMTMTIRPLNPTGPGTSLERPASGSYAGFNPGGTEDDSGDTTYTPTHTSVPGTLPPDAPPGTYVPPVVIPLDQPGNDPLDHPGLEPVDYPNPQLYPDNPPTGGGYPVPPQTPPTTTTTPPNGNGGFVPPGTPPAQAGGGKMAMVLGLGLLGAILWGGKKKPRRKR